MELKKSNKIEEFIKNTPKVTLHTHLDGSLRPETVQILLRNAGINLDLETVKSRLMVSKDCKDLNQYLEKFDLPLSVLQTAENIKRTTFELFEDLSKRNVIYSEVRFAPSLHLQNGLSYEQVVEAAISGMNEAKKKFDIDGGLILCCMRGNNNHQANLDTVNVAKKYLGKGVCAIDLAGAEALFPTKDYKDIFEHASSLGIPFTIHAGEADGPDSIRTALEFGARRIGHGVKCISDLDLINELNDRQILLEICPTSNFQTQAVTGKTNGFFPIEAIYRAGIPVNINTDNDTVSNTDIDDEYRWVLEETSLTPYDIFNTNASAIKASFSSPEKKLELMKKLTDRTKTQLTDMIKPNTSHDNR